MLRCSGALASSPEWVKRDTSSSGSGQRITEPSVAPSRGGAQGLCRSGIATLGLMGNTLGTQETCS